MFINKNVYVAQGIYIVNVFAVFRLNGYIDLF